MEPHNAPIGSTARSKSQAVLIPARGSKLEDYDRTPLIVPECDNGHCVRVLFYGCSYAKLTL